MYNKMVRFLYGVQVLMQAIACLLTPIALGTLGAWLLVRYALVDTWIYAVLILVGTLIGLWSMIRFVLKVSAQLSAIDRASEQKERERRRAQRQAHPTNNADAAQPPEKQ